MKIVPENRQPAVAEPVEKRAEVADLSLARQKKRAARPRKGDVVNLAPSPVEAELKSREGEQAKRVEALKALIESGKYQVSSREVAEKMLSGSSTSDK